MVTPAVVDQAIDKVKEEVVVLETALEIANANGREVVVPTRGPKIGSSR